MIGGASFAIVDLSAADPAPEHPSAPWGPSALSLFNTREPALQGAGPLLVPLTVGTPSQARARAEVAAGHGIAVTADMGAVQLRRHLRRFLLVQTPTGAVTLFRFYDPRVLIAFLTASRTDELTAFFGPIQTFYACAAQLGVLFTLSLAADGGLDARTALWREPAARA